MINIDNMARSLAQQWYAAQSRNNFATLYLYYTPSNGSTPGKVIVADYAIPPYVLASSTRLSPAWTETQGQQFIYEVLRTLPILPAKGEELIED